MNRGDSPGLEYRCDALPVHFSGQSIASIPVRLKEFERVWLVYLFHEPRAQICWDYSVYNYDWTQGQR